MKSRAMRSATVKNALLVLGSILFASLVFEAGLRLAGVSYPILHRMDRDRGWAPWPGIDGVYTAEGRARVRFNRDGIRGPDPSRDKPAGTYRVAVLGDSFTEAREVEEADTFVARMGARLAGCGALAGRRIEALNFGVSGYGTAQQLLTLESAVMAYRPDLVVLALYPENDVSNNSRALDGHPDRPYFVLSGNALVLDRATLDEPRFLVKYAWRNFWNSIVNRVRLFQFLRDAVNKFRYGLRGEARRRPRFLEPSLGDAVFAPPRDPAWDRAWRVTEALVTAMADRVRAAGARFAVAVLSMPVQVYPDKRVREAFAARLAIDTLSYPDQRIAALGADIRVPVIAVAEPLREIAERDGVFFHGFDDAVPGDGHYNRDGHGAVGRIIADGICAALGGAEGGSGPQRRR